MRLGVPTGLFGGGDAPIKQPQARNAPQLNLNPRNLPWAGEGEALCLLKCVTGF